MRRSVLGLAALTVIFALAFWTIRPVLFRATVSAQTQPIVMDRYKTSDSLPDINQIFALVNNQRAAHGLTPVVQDAQLTLIAQERAKDMATNSYYSHQSPDGTYFYDIMKQDKYYVQYGCENLDLAFTLMPDRYVLDWMNSTHGHRECMLNASVTQAGYAATEFTTSNSSKSSQKMYIVVTIYAELPKIAKN